MRSGPAKRNPLFTGEQTLSFGNVPAEEVAQLTPEQKADAFLAKYMDVFNPVGTYDEYFKTSVKGVDHLLKEVKNFYKRLVVTDAVWSERKYVAVINDIFEKRIVFSLHALERGGFLYERDELASQVRASRTGRRRV